MDVNDFIFYRDEENNICSGGYIINNVLKQLDMPIVYGNKNPLQSGGGSLSTMLNNLAVPAGLVLMQQHAANENLGIPSKKTIINEDLHSELLKLVKVSKSKTKKKNENARIRQEKKGKNKL